LVVGIDGVRPDALAEARTPWLDSLIETGVYSELGIAALPTADAPNWSSMLTGVWPEKHGVISNDFSSHRFESWPDFLSRIEAEAPYLNTAAVADWPPLVRPVDGGPLVGSDVDQVVALDGAEMGWIAADSAVAEAAIRILSQGAPHALFVHFGAPDEVGQATGSIGREYIQAIGHVDRQIGRILGALEARNPMQGEEWLVLVSTDHGLRRDGGHGGETMAERTIFYIASGGTPEPIRFGTNPRIVDVAPTALNHLGLSLEGMELDGRVVGQAWAGADTEGESP
jgi:predicted AlkP superfamily pyrophosphatase or phosphodiesterase